MRHPLTIMKDTKIYWNFELMLIKFPAGYGSFLSTKHSNQHLSPPNTCDIWPLRTCYFRHHREAFKNVDSLVLSCSSSLQYICVLACTWLLIIDFISDWVSGQFGSPCLHNGFSTLSANSDVVTQTIRSRSNRKIKPVPQSGRSFWFPKPSNNKFLLWILSIKWPISSSTKQLSCCTDN